jgi:hypothetical protein
VFCRAFSDERTGLRFTVAASPRQRSPPWIPVPWDPRPNYIVPILETLPTWRTRYQYLYLPGADRLDNVRSLTSHNPIGLQGLLRDSFTLWRRNVLPVRYKLDSKYYYK